MQFKIKRRDHPVIEMAPLIDVVFLLLLFFMVTTQFASLPGLKITLPEIKRGSTVTATAKVEINLTAAGDIYLSGNPVSLDHLPAALKKAAEDPDSTVVVLAADQDTPHGKVIALLDVIRRQGFKRLVFSARWEGESKSK